MPGSSPAHLIPTIPNRISLFYPFFLNKKCQENPTPSTLKGWARWSWHPEAHQAPSARMIPASLRPRKTWNKQGQADSCISLAVSSLPLNFVPPSKGRADGLCREMMPWMLFTAGQKINICRGSSSLAICHWEWSSAGGR